MFVCMGSIIAQPTIRALIAVPVYRQWHRNWLPGPSESVWLLPYILKKLGSFRFFWLIAYLKTGGPVKIQVYSKRRREPGTALFLCTHDNERSPFSTIPLLTGPVHAQQFVFPDAPSWTNMEEGKPLSFRLATTDSTAPRRFALRAVPPTGMSMGQPWQFHGFLLRPRSRLEKQKEFGVLFQAEWKDGRQLRQSVNFILHHVNRPPIVEDMLYLFMKQGTLSRYQIPTEYVRDPMRPLVVIKPRESQMPEGASMSATGLFTDTSRINSMHYAPQ